MKVWVARSSEYNEIKLFIEKPTKSRRIFYGVNGEFPLVRSGSGWFKKHFGFTPRKGSCKQMELSLTEIT